MILDEAFIEPDGIGVNLRIFRVFSRSETNGIKHSVSATCLFFLSEYKENQAIRQSTAVSSVTALVCVLVYRTTSINCSACTIVKKRILGSEIERRSTSVLV